MKTEIDHAIEALMQSLKDYAPKETVSFQFFMNSEGCEIITQSKTPDQLKSAGISMRNLRGEFIK